MSYSMTDVKVPKYCEENGESLLIGRIASRSCTATP